MRRDVVHEWERGAKCQHGHQSQTGESMNDMGFRPGQWRQLKQPMRPMPTAVERFSLLVWILTGLVD